MQTIEITEDMAKYSSPATSLPETPFGRHAEATEILTSLHGHMGVLTQKERALVEEIKHGRVATVGQLVALRYIAERVCQ